MGASGTIQWSVSLTGTDNRYTLQDSIDPLSLSVAQIFSTGAGAIQGESYTNKIDAVIHAQYDLAAAATQSIDLRALEDFAGNTVQFVTVRALVFNAHDDDTYYEIEPDTGAAAPWVSWLASGSLLNVYGPGSELALNPTATGWAVAAGNKDFKITNAGANAGTIDVIIAGNV